jgi:hypothetical protein
LAMEESDRLKLAPVARRLDSRDMGFPRSFSLLYMTYGSIYWDPSIRGSLLNRSTFVFILIITMIKLYLSDVTYYLYLHKNGNRPRMITYKHL